ncbi:MAG TPA: D-alanyl-D-alanine carboxypeptidase/D-alanyl-D-alanine-endopeptidase [Bdellovibrionales bacterium]|nr:MAG: D-alanyl-D-alanine carboxypeptidase/D-alanyl-D-alanine-endopeptidase [Bdellovibrionales bacterium GWB1_52_6]OFZ03721.1 MAG: D-alanyl-D-alanine carboxypeptidase/D-alanyl-D-alanine-endopeptidase [Bdellovibrionales bacterium GWA1_52_35]HAR42246.1 D-alanyl-D-alanine carboxypeptidase/D-alanyl-D-alanine-endopeptidase [Bdellovibrionales bacterium]HCM38767.1 D-alanyl-D-alanine carboxypeptidase/D-alanyl-D-alanine-endopeptidase [Bdellovibrionales bacterium]
MACKWIFALTLFCAFSTEAFAALERQLPRPLDSRLGSSEFVEMGSPDNERVLLPELKAEPVQSRSRDHSEWDSIIDQGAQTPIFFGVRIAGPLPYLRNPVSRFAPASNSKLFTAAAALHYLGADFTIDTRLEWKTLKSSSDTITELKLIGSGDPTWGMVEFGEDLTTRVDQLAAALYARGVRKIQGSIKALSADPRWDLLTYPEGWSPADRTACYGALGQSFNLDINCAEYIVTGAKAGHWADPALQIPVKFKISSGSSTEVYAKAFDLPGIVAAGFEIRGSFHPSSGPVSLILPIHHSRGRVQRHFVAALERLGLEVEKEVNIGQNLSDIQSLTFQSPTLSEMLKPFLKLSLNHMGDVFLKVLGQNFGDSSQGLIAAGQGVLRQYVEQMAEGRFAKEVVLYDGSGVSRSSSTTTGALMALLDTLQARADFPVLWEALPIAGVDGTLKDRMKGTAAAGVLRAKTGTLSGVYNLSGYVPRYSRSGIIQEYVPFVMLSRTSWEFKDEARAAQNRVGAVLSQKVNRE